MKTNFFAELKRRNVYKVAVAYAVVAWLLAQIATQIFPFLEIPNWAIRLVILLLALGFPIALILAWAFELTPEGVKRADGSDPERSKGRAWIYVAIVAAALSIGLFFLGRFTASNKPSGSAEVSSKSIAVLPFESLSEDKNNAYFADGIQDEILARLSKIADLKVISRTSTQKYKSAPDNLREIAQQLAVTNILEGSVQKAGEQVRITVQLINARNDSHLWAESYDRQITDIFGVESDVAQKIAESLEAKLTGREKHALATVGTTNPQAYDSFLRGLALRNSLSDADSQKRIAAFRRAVELDPDYADAWSMLAIEQAILFRSPLQSDALKKETQTAAETALRLAPDSAQAHEAMGLYDGYCLNKTAAALAQLEIARQHAPNDGGILSALGIFQRAQGKVDEAVATMKKAAELDPLNLNVWTGLAITYFGLRQFGNVRAMLERALTLAPNDLDVIGGIAESYQSEGNLEAAWKVLAPYPFPDSGEWAFTVYHEQYYLWRDYGFLIETIKGMNIEAKNIAILTAAQDVLLANLYLLNGQRDLALSVSGRAEREMQDLRARNFGLFELSGAYIECAARLGRRDEVEREVKFVFARMGDNQWLLPMCEDFAARGYTLLGDFDKALPLLQDSLAKPNGTTVAYLRLNPAWDSVRGDPRFRKLLVGKP